MAIEQGILDNLHEALAKDDRSGLNSLRDFFGDYMDYRAKGMPDIARTSAFEREYIDSLSTQDSPRTPAVTDVFTRMRGYEVLTRTTTKGTESRSYRLEMSEGDDIVFSAETHSRLIQLLSLGTFENPIPIEPLSLHVWGNTQDKSRAKIRSMLHDENVKDKLESKGWFIENKVLDRGVKVGFFLTRLVAQPLAGDELSVLATMLADKFVRAGEKGVVIHNHGEIPSYHVPFEDILPALQRIQRMNGAKMFSPKASQREQHIFRKKVQLLVDAENAGEILADEASYVQVLFEWLKNVQELTQQNVVSTLLS